MASAPITSPCNLDIDEVEAFSRTVSQQPWVLYHSVMLRPFGGLMMVACTSCDNPLSIAAQMPISTIR